MIRTGYRDAHIYREHGGVPHAKYLCSGYLCCFYTNPFWIPVVPLAMQIACTQLRKRRVACKVSCNTMYVRHLYDRREMVHRGQDARVDRSAKCLWVQ